MVRLPNFRIQILREDGSESIVAETTLISDIDGTNIFTFHVADVIGDAAGEVVLRGLCEILAPMLREKCGTRICVHGIWPGHEPLGYFVTSEVE